MSKIIYDFLMEEFKNPYGVCALMGNLYAESGLKSNNLQNNGNRQLNMTDEEYTKAVDNGSYKNFIRDSYGYGLAQWTYWSRKQNLIMYAINAGASIGDLSMQLCFLINELKAYKTVYSAIKNAKDVRSASDVIVKQYERPANQSEENLVKRATYGLNFYKEFAEASYKDDGYILYTVVKGDSLWKIAKNFYGSGLKYPEIMKFNNLKTTRINVGQVLKIKEM